MVRLCAIASHVLLFALLVTLSAPVSAAEPTVEWLDKRLRKVEEKLEQAEDDELPWDEYVGEFGGRIMADFTVNTDQDQALLNNLGAAEDGFEFRRLRLYVEGPIGEFIAYKVQFDFAGNNAELKDGYITVSDLGFVPDVTIGHFKEPFSLDELTSSKYITFMARSALSDGFSSEYNPGVKASGHWWDDRVNLTVALQQANVSGLETPTTDSNHNVTARLTSPLHYSREGRSVIHGGLAYSLQQPNSNGRYVKDLEPEVHKGDPEFLELNIPNVENWDQYGVEAATVIGPLSFQTEWAQHSIHRETGRNPDVDSYYLFGSYFLTGEHRPYDRGDGDFGRVKPRSPFKGVSKGGSGAWEVAARFSHTDYTEGKGITTLSDNLASKMDIVTLGLNWYPHPHAKWMLNYVDADHDDFNASAQWVATRFQVDF